MIQTCSTPDRGYMGDIKRGASLGRGARTAQSAISQEKDEIASLERVLRDLGDASCDYLFTHLNRDERNELARQHRLSLRAARERLAAAEKSAANECPKFHLRRVPLNSGGYDAGGAYWGHGDPLFEAFTADGIEFMTFRVGRDETRAAFEARGGVPIGEPGHAEFAARFPYWWRDGRREAAKDIVRERHECAQFYR